MADYVTKIRTSTGDKQIDYNALANLPNVATLGSDGKVPVDQLPSMDYIPTSEKGAANGVAILDNSGKVPSGQLPSMDYIPTSQKGAASGVASLGSDGKVPSGQLPSMNYIPTAQKGVASGVASLDSSGKVPSSQLNLSNSVSSTSTTTAANSAAVKTAYDKAVSAYNLANGALKASSGTPTLSAYGSYPAPTLNGGGWVRIGNLVVVDIEISSNLDTPSNTTDYDFTINGLPTSELSEDIFGTTWLHADCRFFYHPYNGLLSIANIINNYTLYGSCRITFSYIAQ